MATINDIAREAGVSHGTVSNVLNGRCVVSTEKIRLVLEAAQRLGYRMNSTAQGLRQSASKTVALILSSLVYDWCAVLYEELKKELAASGYSLTIYSTGGLESSERQQLTLALGNHVCAVIADSCLADAPSYYEKEASGIPVFLLRQAPLSDGGICTAGFEYDRMGREVADYLIRRKARAVGLMTAENSSYVTCEFLKAFHHAVARQGITAHIVACADHQVDVQAFSLFKPDLCYDYIFCADLHRLRAAKIAHSYVSRQKEPQYIAVAPQTALTDIRRPYYGLDYKMLSHQIKKALIHALEKNERPVQRLVIRNDGFPKLPPFHAKPSELNMLTVSSPSADALVLLAPQLEASQGIRLNLSILSLDEIFQLLKKPDSFARFDLIRMDAAWMNELAASIYRPFDDIDYDWSRLTASFSQEFTSDYISVGGVRYALPFDPSTQLLFYRKDLFENPLYRRMFYETTGKHLDIPQTFEEYNSIAGFFTQSHHAESSVPYGTTIAIGNNMVIASEYYVRLLALQADLLDADGNIALVSPEAIAALTNLTQAFQYTDGAQHQWWKDALKGFAEGSTAMTVVFMNHASNILNLRDSTIAGKVGYASVPGGRPLSGGGVLGISRYSRKTSEACRFFDWLYSAPIAAAFTLVGGLSPCRSVYNNRDIYEKYPWLSAAKKSFSKAQHRRSSNLYEDFSQYRLEKILSQEVKSAVLGMEKPEDALRRAQRICEKAFHRKL